MDFLIEEYQNVLKQLKTLKSEPYYSFKPHLIEITENALANFDLQLPNFKIGDKSIIEGLCRNPHFDNKNNLDIPVKVMH
ncbi:MAG: hypothetical protein PWP14_2354 [Methanolobus sp.]|nr:hypothetical protein [Methanolobus sp.]